MPDKRIIDAMNLLFRAAPLTPGDVMRDGSIYAGVSPENSKPMFIMPGKPKQDREAYPDARAVAEMNAGAPLGCDDWRVPTLRELNVIFDNSRQGNLKEAFHTASNPYWGVNLYWSSTPGGLAYWRRPEGYDAAHWREQRDFKTGDYDTGNISAHQSFVCYVRGS